MLASFHFGILIFGPWFLKFSPSIYLLFVLFRGKGYEESWFPRQEGLFPFSMTSPEGQPLALKSKLSTVHEVIKVFLHSHFILQETVISDFEISF